MPIHRFLVSCLLVCTVVVQPVSAGGGQGPAIFGIQPLVATHNALIDLGQRYALGILALDYNGTAHVASAGYYNNPWIRDSFAWGMIPEQTGASLQAYATSEIAYWVARQQKFGGWLTAPKSGYFDETPIFISALLAAYNVTHDKRQLQNDLPAAERAWHWLASSYIQRRRGSDVLLFANVPPHVASDWVDQIARTGYATQLEALWYRATLDLGLMEHLLGRTVQAKTYAAFAARVKQDINRLLWTDAAPFSYHAPAVSAFGHYKSWLGPREYFELDSNFLCILYGIADTQQAASITGFVKQHAGYLLGLSTAEGVPARVVYGDYAPADYASKRNRIGVEQYQNAYWPTVGALAAMGLARTGSSRLATELLERIAATARARGDLHEWYDSAGNARGAPHFQWAARMYLLAVIDVSRSLKARK